MAVVCCVCAVPCHAMRSPAAPEPLSSIFSLIFISRFSLPLFLLPRNRASLALPIYLSISTTPSFSSFFPTFRAVCSALCSALGFCVDPFFLPTCASRGPKLLLIFPFLSHRLRALSIFPSLSLSPLRSSRIFGIQNAHPYSSPASFGFLVLQ